MLESQCNLPGQLRFAIGQQAQKSFGQAIGELLHGLLTNRGELAAR